LLCTMCLIGSFQNVHVARSVMEQLSPIKPVVSFRFKPISEAD
jgi:hypothetical protein